MLTSNWERDEIFSTMPLNLWLKQPNANIFQLLKIFKLQQPLSCHSLMSLQWTKATYDVTSSCRGVITKGHHFNHYPSWLRAKGRGPRCRKGTGVKMSLDLIHFFYERDARVKNKNKDTFWTTVDMFYQQSGFLTSGSALSAIYECLFLLMETQQSFIFL